LRVGAEVALEPGELEHFERWEPDKISARAVDVVLECSGKKVAMEAGLSQLRRGGRLVLVGAGMEPPTFDPNRMLLNELEIHGSFIYDADGFDRAIELLASGVLPVDELIDPTDVPLDLLGDALVGLADGSIPGKVMVVPQVSTRQGAAK
jgi:threonine dehydrogenase-like Zn-dependent dehydrogenase